MFCDSEDLLQKDNIIAPENTDAVDRTEYSYIENTIKNYLNECQNYKWDNFEGAFTHNHTDNSSNIGFNPFEFNLNANDEKEEYPNIYYNSFGQEYLLFKKARNAPDDKPNENSNFRNNKRFDKRLPRHYNNDNVRRVIKVGFFNRSLKPALNIKLKQLGYKELFHNFPQKLVRETAKKKNKDLMNMTLFQIFETNDSYIGQDAKNFEYNLNIIKKIKNAEKGEIYFILNKKFYEIFEEYRNSDEFKEEIGRINSKHQSEKNKEFLIQRYAYLAKTFVQYYWQ